MDVRVRAAILLVSRKRPFLRQFIAFNDKNFIFQTQIVFESNMKMKSLKTNLIVAAYSLIIGILTVKVWFIMPAPEVPSDPTVYSVQLCSLITNPNQYDGKLVRLKALYYQGVERLHLADYDSCLGQLRATYFSQEEHQKAMQQIIITRFPDVAKVDLIGRFTAKIPDPNPPQQKQNIQFLEIHELKGVEVVRW